MSDIKMHSLSCLLSQAKPAVDVLRTVHSWLSRERDHCLINEDLAAADKPTVFEEGLLNQLQVWLTSSAFPEPLLKHSTGVLDLLELRLGCYTHLYNQMEQKQPKLELLLELCELLLGELRESRFVGLLSRDGLRKLNHSQRYKRYMVVEDAAFFAQNPFQQILEDSWLGELECVHSVPANRLRIGRDVSFIWSFNQSTNSLSSIRCLNGFRLLSRQLSDVLVEDRLCSTVLVNNLVDYLDSSITEAALFTPADDHVQRPRTQLSEMTLAEPWMGLTEPSLLSVKLVEQHCVPVLQQIEAETVDLVLTDPPFALGLFVKKRDTNLGQMRENFFGDAQWDDLTNQEWEALMSAFLEQSFRTLKPGGAVIVFMSIMRIETLIRLAQAQGFYYKTTGIWHKTNPMPRNMNLHYINSTEAWLYLIKPQENGRKTGVFNNAGKALHDFVETSVTGKSEKQLGRHPTQKPLGLLQHFIRVHTHKGGVVLDPFMGSGSTGVASVQLDRQFIGVERKREYFKLSSQRIVAELDQHRLRAAYRLIRLSLPNVIDLFAGVGGFSTGFLQESFRIDAAVEKDSVIAQAYSHNHPDTVMHNVNIEKVPLAALFGSKKGTTMAVIGGPPCTGFSKKGKRQKQDSRNFLYQKYVETIARVEPIVFVIENVTDFITAWDGHFISNVRSDFQQLGYDIVYKVLCASDFGVPQDRERAVIIGSRVGLPSFDDLEEAPKVSIREAISDLAFLNSGEGTALQDYVLPPQSLYQQRMRHGALKLTNHKATKHDPLTLNKLRQIPRGKGKEVLPKHLLTKSIFSGTWSRMLEHKQSITITTRFDTPSSGRFTHYELDRCITVREAARIQSFPDSFTFIGAKKFQMQQVGNAVPPLLGRAIARLVFKWYAQLCLSDRLPDGSSLN